MLDNDLEKVVVELVGDLAAYRPHAKVVILEGGGPDGFDEKLIRRLYPDFAKQVNLVSGGPKRRVRDLYDALNQAATTAGITNRFFAIVDKDGESYTPPEQGAQEFMWRVYHIENFLLEPSAIREACVSLTGSDPFATDEQAVAALKAEAVKLLDSLVLERVRSEVDAVLVTAIKIEGDPNGTDIAKDLLPSVVGSLQRVQAEVERQTPEALALRVEDLRSTFQTAVDEDRWAREFPGRRILKRFVDTYGGGVGYEAFRNVVVDKLAQDDERPAEMSAVLNTIVGA